MNFNDLPRECFSAISKHIKEYIKDIPVFYENDNDAKRPLTRIEVRIDGPDITEIANTQYHLVVEVDLLILCEKSDNIFKIRNLMGQCAEALREDINFSGASYLSTSKPYGGAEKTNVAYFGSKDKNVLQASVSTRLHSLLL